MHFSCESTFSSRGQGMLCLLSDSTLKSESTISQRNVCGLSDEIFVLLEFRKIPPQNIFALQFLLFLFYLF